MIELKKKNGFEFKYDTETKLYLNEESNKWVKNPRLQKGKFKGNKKDKIYIEQYNKLKEEYPELSKFTLVTPKYLTDIEILNVLEQYKNDYNFDFKYELEIGKLLLSKILISRTYTNKDTNNKKEFIQIPKTEFLYWIGNYYLDYLKAFIIGNVIECDDIYYNFEFNKKALSYKINDNYFKKDRILGGYYKNEPLTHWRLKVKCFQNKIDLKNKIYNNENEHYKILIEYTEILFRTINITEFEEYYINNLYEFYDINNKDEIKNQKELEETLKNEDTILLNDFIQSIISIQEGNFYFNVKDTFGERFHSPFTNKNSCIRKWINYEDEQYMEIDIVNSQMSFFSLLLSEPDKIKQLIPEHQYIYDEISEFIDKEDVKLFCKKSFDGILYEWMSTELNIDRKEAKQYMFATIFSDEITNLKKKYKLSKLIPNIIYICNRLNSWNRKLVPKLCQRLESRLMIQRIAINFLQVNKYPFFTVHDSFNIHPGDKLEFLKTYNKIFEDLNIEPLKIKMK
jgi:hypothetical protein